MSYPKFVGFGCAVSASSGFSEHALGMDSLPVTISGNGVHGAAKKRILVRITQFLMRLGVRAGLLRPRIAAAVLAGGRSRRLGRNKALLPLLGKTCIEKIIYEVRSCVKDVTIITNSPDDYVHLGYPCCVDVLPGGGPLSGIHAALSHCEAECVLVVSCDIPLVNRDIFQKLIAALPGHDIVIYKHKHFEPLCALYRRTCIPALEDLIAHGEYRIIDLFPTLKVKALRIGPVDVFKNINTDADYQYIRKKLSDMEQDTDGSSSPDSSGQSGMSGSDDRV